MMKQKEWIETIVAKTGCTKKEAKLYFDIVFDYMREQINPEEVVKISGLGVFKLRKTADKEQINLITGKPEIVPAHNVVTFRPYFEIDPKPEAIEVDDEEEAIQATEVASEEVVAEVAAAEVPAAEEAPVAEEAPAAEEAPVEVAAAEVPAEEDDGFVWKLNGNDAKTSDVRKYMKDNSNLTDGQIDNALCIVVSKLNDADKKEVEVKESADKFEFVIAK